MVGKVAMTSSRLLTFSLDFNAVLRWARNVYPFNNALVPLSAIFLQVLMVLLETKIIGHYFQELLPFSSGGRSGNESLPSAHVFIGFQCSLPRENFYFKLD